MVKDSVLIEDEAGLHARPASELAKSAMTFTNCNIKLRTADKEVDAKSVLAVMTLGAKKGTEIEVECDGENEQKALDALVEIIKNN